MNISKYFPHAITVILLVLAGVYKSPAFAYASVLALIGVLAANVVDMYQSLIKLRATPMDEATKRKITDLEARVSTIEFGIKQRGF
jgi:integral membrane sensor domain MASE1